MDHPGQYYLEYVYGNIANLIMNRLINDFGIEYVKKDECFSTDEEFRNYIHDNNYDTLLGGQGIFDSYDYEDYRNHVEFINVMKCIFIPTAKSGIAMKCDSVGFSIDDVNVDIVSPELDEVNFLQRNNEAGTYICEITSGQPIEFEENEIREYLHDDRKLIKISINASISVGEKSDCIVMI